MMQAIEYITFLVREYDEAISFFTQVLGFKLTHDSAMSEGKRWVLVSPDASNGTQLLLAKATTPEQKNHIGNQAGGRVFLFLHTDDFWRDYRNLKSKRSEVQRGAARRSVGDSRGFQRPLRK